MGRSRPKNRRKKLNLVLESAPLRKKRKGPFHSPGSLSGLIVITIFIGVIGVSLFALSKSVMALFVEDPRFAVSRVEVTNVRIFTPEEIVALAGIPVGTNIFSVDLAEAKKRIEDNPNIKRADLSRAFPDSVQVRVYEREPVAIEDREAAVLSGP
ncbi:MAG TPA: FtsQ-type POTRA domain-containing protein, partial [bacterium]|nr:FtsQ-type POTRA domain-containing protein [bacterium]